MYFGTAIEMAKAQVRLDGKMRFVRWPGQHEVMVWMREDGEVVAAGFGEQAVLDALSAPAGERE